MGDSPKPPFYKGERITTVLFNFSFDENLNCGRIYTCRYINLMVIFAAILSYNCGKLKESTKSSADCLFKICFRKKNYAIFPKLY